MRMKARLEKAGDAILRTRPFILIGLFTIADTLAGFLHTLRYCGVLHSRFFHMARERGCGELVQYAKFGVILLILSRWRRATPSRLLTAWIILFVVLLLDDSIGIHEAAGAWMLRFVAGAELWGMRAKDITEAVSLILLEGSLCLYVVYRFFRASAPLRRTSIWIALSMVPLAASMLLDLATLKRTEDVAEMLSMSILLATVYHQYRRARLAPMEGESPREP